MLETTQQLLKFVTNDGVEDGMRELQDMPEGMMEKSFSFCHDGNGVIVVGRVENRPRSRNAK